MPFIPKIFKDKWNKNSIDMFKDLLEKKESIGFNDFKKFEKKGFKVENDILILSGLYLENTYDKVKVIENINFYFSYFLCCNFKDVHFKNVNFSHCTFDEIYLRRTNFENCIFIGTKFINSDLEKTNFNESILRHSSFRNCKINKIQIENTITNSENNKSPESHDSKRDLYSQLKSNCYSSGDYDSANYFKKRELDELILKYKLEKNYLKWLFGKIFILTTGYGYKPSYVLKSSLLLITFFSIIYLFTGFNTSSGRINYEFSLNVSDWLNLKEFFLSLIHSFYFSFITFSNFTSNNYTPINNIFNAILNPIENLLGIIIFSLFVVVSANRFYRG